MKDNSNVMRYVRIGTQLFIYLNVPTRSGESRMKLQEWSYSNMTRDFGKNKFPRIEVYYGTVCIPSHLEYKRAIEADGRAFWNTYEPLPYEPAAGDCPNWLNLVHHIFGEKYEMGMDYLQLLYTQPLQKLPVLVLVSHENNTGKTTFCSLLHTIFGPNSSFIDSDAFRSQFNSEWIEKNLIVIDEANLSKDDMSKMKELSTGKFSTSEAKGKNRKAAEPFMKFIINGNNECNPLYLTEDDTRYWVIRVEPISREDPDFALKAEKEIPAFLDYLAKRKLTTCKESRMWFAPQSYRTPAFDKIVHYCRDVSDLDLEEMLLEVMKETGKDELCFSLKDLYQLSLRKGISLEKRKIKTILHKDWNLDPVKSRYKTIYFNGHGYEERFVGSGYFFRINRDFLEGKEYD